jgi:putative ABC transport system ATP-binding protein
LFRSGQEPVPEEVAALRGVWRAYREGEYVLRGVDMSVSKGEFVGVHGRSGSGKSTLLRLIGLLDRPTRGEVWVLGSRTDRLRSAEAARMRLESVGFVFQSLNLIQHITVLENIEVPMWLKGEDGAERRRRAMELLEQFGMQGLAERYPTEISAGEQQRVAAIRALVNRPRILVADEPTAHLDDENAGLLMEMLSRLNREMGVTLVLSTTSREEAGRASRVYELLNGRLCQGETTSSSSARP